MAELYLLQHEADGETHSYPVYLRKPPNPGEITNEFLMNLAEQLSVLYDHSYHHLRLSGSYKPEDIPYVDAEGKLEKPACAEFAIEAPTYYGSHDPLPEGKAEWDAPFVPILVRASGGLRIVLGAHDTVTEPDLSVPDVYIERRPGGWAMFIHPVGDFDAIGYFYILDDGRTFFDKEYWADKPEGFTLIEYDQSIKDVATELDSLPPLPRPAEESET